MRACVMQSVAHSLLVHKHRHAEEVFLRVSQTRQCSSFEGSVQYVQGNTIALVDAAMRVSQEEGVTSLFIVSHHELIVKNKMGGRLCFHYVRSSLSSLVG